MGYVWFLNDILYTYSTVCKQLPDIFRCIRSSNDWLLDFANTQVIFGTV